MRSAATEMAWVPYHKQEAEMGLIEPEFVDEIVGWENEPELIAAGFEAILEIGSLIPVAWIRGWPGNEAIEPIPRQERTLRWRRTY